MVLDVFVALQENKINTDNKAVSFFISSCFGFKNTKFTLLSLITQTLSLSDFLKLWTFCISE